MGELAFARGRGSIYKFLNVFDRKIVDNWCKTMLFNGITHSNNNVVNRKTIGVEGLEYKCVICTTNYQRFPIIHI